MKFLLDEDEYLALTTKSQETVKVRTQELKDKLQEACTLAAETVPVPREWSSDKEPKPWGCILSKDSNPGYCDDCPVTKKCPCNHKRYSK